MKQRPPHVVRFPQTPRQLAVLRTLSAVGSGPDVDERGIFLDRHDGKAAGTMTKLGAGEKPLVESTFDDRYGRSRYKITAEGRLALARAEADEAERAKRYDPFGPQAARR